MNSFDKRPPSSINKQEYLHHQTPTHPGYTKVLLPQLTLPIKKTNISLTSYVNGYTVHFKIPHLILISLKPAITQKPMIISLNLNLSRQRTSCTLKINLLFLASCQSSYLNINFWISSALSGYLFPRASIDSFTASLTT